MMQRSASIPCQDEYGTFHEHSGVTRSIVGVHRVHASMGVWCTAAAGMGTSSRSHLVIGEVQDTEMLEALDARELLDLVVREPQLLECISL